MYQMQHRTQLSVCSIAVIALYFSSQIAHSEKDDDVCDTEECKNIAKTIMDSVDPNVEPCDNFYRYACGGFINRTVIPSDKSKIDVFENIIDSVSLQLNETLTSDDKGTISKLSAFKNVKVLYEQCMNTGAREENGLDPLHKELASFGKWPVLHGNSWDNTNFDWLQTYIKLDKAGYLDYFVSVYILQDFKNSSRRLIQIDQPTLKVDTIYLQSGFNNSMVMDYYEFLVKSAELLGADPDSAARELRDSIDFEMKIGNISLLPEQRLNTTALYNVMSFSELKIRYPYIQWSEIMKTIIPPEITIGDDEVINVFVPSYFSGLEILLKETPSRVIANYLLSRVVADAAPYLNKDMRQIEFEWTSKKDGSTTRLPRWHECVKLVSKNLPIALGSLYVRQHFGKEMKDYAIQVVENLLIGMKDTLRSLDWMEEKTRQRALTKLDAIFSVIGFPDELLDDSKIEEYYKGLQFSDNYVRNVIMMNKFVMDKLASSLRKSVDRKEWTDYAAVATVNAYYNFITNAIWFPAAILQNVLYKINRPGYMNYPRLGFTIGHEITHAFDSFGRQFDESGMTFDWWDSTTAEKFEKRAKCMQQQYEDYTVEQIGMNLNGERTLPENIGDNGGIRIARIAYNSYVAKLGVKEKKLPDIKWDSHQLFWLSYANMWCTKYTDAYLKNLVNTDYHSPGEFRVNGPLSNMLEFSDAFGCSSDTRMNATNKCRVW